MSLQDRPGTDGCHVSILVVSYGVSTQSHWWETVIHDVFLSIGTHIQLPSHLLWSSNMLRCLASLNNLLTCLRPLNPGEYFINDWVGLFHVSCDGFRFVFIVFFVLFEYFVEKFSWAFTERFHYFIFFCSTLFVISLILVHNFWSNRCLLINLISFSLLLLISYSFQKLKYTCKVLLFNYLINISILIPVLNMAKRWIEWFWVVVFH